MLSHSAVNPINKKNDRSFYSIMVKQCIEILHGVNTDLSALGIIQCVLAFSLEGVGQQLLNQRMQHFFVGTNRKKMFLHALADAHLFNVIARHEF